MPLSDYQITVYSPVTGEALRVFDGTAFYNLTYARVLNDVGTLVMTLDSEAGITAYFPLDALVEIERTSPITGRLEVEDVYLVRLTHRYREGSQERYLVGGMSANHLLTRRIIDPTDDPLAAGGYSTKAGPADQIMRAYAREQCGDLASILRRFPNFTIAESLDVGLAAGRRLRYDNLFEVFQDLAEAGHVDFNIRRVYSNLLRLEIGIIGSDKTQTTNYPVSPFVRLDPDRGNMGNPSLLIDRKKEQNYVYALGQGPGEKRILVNLAGIGIGDSPYNRIEFKTDVRVATRGDTTAILTSARRALVDKQATLEFTFTPTGVEPGNTYRADWDLGDQITAAWDDQQVNLRVTEVEIEISRDGEDITPTVKQIYE